MGHIEEQDNSHQLLLDLLSEESNNRSIPQELWQGLEEQYGENLYSRLLYFLTQLDMPPDEARCHWHEIIGHRDKLTRAIGRDPGLRVALADYFINLHPRVNNPILVEINLFLKKEEFALRDELTGIYNRRFFNRVLQEELERARRFKEEVSLLMVDVDKFKNFNDKYGHPAGDQALVEVARILGVTSRQIDHVTRYGGEEFALILPRSDRKQAAIAAERHRAAMEAHEFGPKSLRITISLGAATYPVDAADGLQLIEEADQALYRAKRAGRNKVVSSSSEKRRHPRYPLELGLKYRYQENGKTLHDARARNISLGGLLGQTPNMVEEDRLLDVRLANPNGEPFYMQGRCVRVHHEPDQSAFYIGVKFENNSSRNEEALKELIAQGAE